MLVITQKIFEKAFEKHHGKKNKHNKSFWKFIKPFLTNKGFIGGNDITLVKNDVVTTEEKALARTFNKNYINIVEISSGNPPKKSFKIVTW